MFKHFASTVSFFNLVGTIFCLSIGSFSANAQGLLEDLNGNGVVEVVAFGDSITRGVGDFNAPGNIVSDAQAQNFPGGEAGYPLRLESFLGIGIQNAGFNWLALRGVA